MAKPKGAKTCNDVRALARKFTRTAIFTLAEIIKDTTVEPRTRAYASNVLLCRGWGSPNQKYTVDVNDTRLLKVVNEIVHVHETREQVEFKDQQPLLELKPQDAKGNGSKSTH